MVILGAERENERTYTRAREMEQTTCFSSNKFPSTEKFNSTNFGTWTQCSNYFNQFLVAANGAMRHGHHSTLHRSTWWRLGSLCLQVCGVAGNICSRSVVPACGQTCSINYWRRPTILLPRLRYLPPQLRCQVVKFSMSAFRELASGAKCDKRLQLGRNSNQLTDGLFQFLLKSTKAAYNYLVTRCIGLGSWRLSCESLVS